MFTGSEALALSCPTLAHIFYSCTSPVCPSQCTRFTSKNSMYDITDSQIVLFPESFGRTAQLCTRNTETSGHHLPCVGPIFISSGHVYGALVMHLLQINRIHSSTRMLKVIQWLCPKVIVFTMLTYIVYTYIVHIKLL